MNVRPAEMSDLSRLKAMYGKIVENMFQNGIRIWNQIFPVAFLQEDIEKDRLYLLTEGAEILAAFALCDSNEGAGSVKWKDANAKAVYIGRVGVSTDHLRKGLGGRVLESAMNLARQMGAAYLRLFVVDQNRPAINLYLKNGFARADGVYEERYDDVVLVEYGFEKAL